jgi:hypothetical protein
MSNGLYTQFARTKPFRLATAAASDNKTLVAPGTIHVKRIVVRNGAAITYLHLYDAASAAAVTPGTTTPDLTIALSPSILHNIWVDQQFNLGLVIATTTGPANGTAVLANAIDGLGIIYDRVI